MGKAKRFNGYDSDVQNARNVVENFGLSRQKLSVGSSFRNMPQSPPTAVSTGSADATGTGTFCSASIAADQTTNITATDHIEFDTLDEDGGITLQTGAGQADGIFELSAGKKYYLSGAVRPEFSGATGQLTVAWYDITNTSEVGKRAIYEAQTHASNNANQPNAEVIITPTTNITVELRIIGVTALTAIATEYSQVNIFEIALGGSSGSGSGGGGSGVSFPITPTINDHGNVGTTTEDLDLSASTGHIHKITLTGNPTLTFSNPPSSGTQIEFEIEFVQDATGGRTVTFPASVAETVTISSVASSTTIVTVRTNDGGTTYHAIPALRGSISLNGGTQFANTGLSNLVSPTLNTSLNVNSYDFTNVDRIQLTSSSGAVSSASTPTIYLDGTSNMVANVATSKSFVVTVNDSATIPFSINSTGFIAMTGLPLNSSQNLGGSGTEWGNVWTDNLKGATIDSTNTLSGTIVDGSLSFSTNIRQTFNPGGTVAGINVGQNGGDPSTLVNGDMWYNTVTDKLKAYVNSSAVDVVTGDLDQIADNDTSVAVSDSGLAATTTIDGTQTFTIGATRTDWNQHHDVFGAASFSFYDTVDAASATVLQQNASDFTINCPVNSDAYNFEFNSVLGLSIDLLRTRLYSNTPNTAEPILSLYRNDPSPTALDVVGTIKFDGEDSASNLQNYAEIEGIARTVTSGSEDGGLTVSVLSSGTSVESLRVKPGELELNHFSSGASEAALLSLIKEDVSPLDNENIGTIAFTVFDTPTETTYAQIQGLTDDVTNSGALALKIRADNALSTALSIFGDDNNTQYAHSYTDESRLFPVTGNMLFSVKAQSGLNDFSSNVGTSGTMIIPFINDGSPSLTDLNQAFGAFDGAIGLDINDGKLYVRESSSSWSYYAQTGTVT